MFKGRISKILIGPVALALALAVVWSGTAGRSSPVDAQTISPAGYVAAAPSRILDTRSAPGPTVNVPFTVQTGLAGVTAVAVNLTVTQAAGAGFTAAWAAGAWPGTSASNFSPGGDIANFIVVPVAADGSFQLMTSATSEMIVDLMGYYTTAGSIATGGGVTATITGYGPGSTITSVVGTATNGRTAAADIRVDVRCPNGTVEIDFLFDMPAGATIGWSVICDGAFTSGATVSVVDV